MQNVRRQWDLVAPALSLEMKLYKSILLYKQRPEDVLMMSPELQSANADFHSKHLKGSKNVAKDGKGERMFLIDNNLNA